MKKVGLEPLKADDKERFILDNQEAFRYGATEEFGMRDDHFEEDGEIISRATIEKAIEEGEAYRILCDGEVVGGAVVRVNGDKGVPRSALCISAYPQQGYRLCRMVRDRADVSAGKGLGDRHAVF